MKDKILVAKLGRSVGLKGDIRIIIESDFPQSFKKDIILYTNKNQALKIQKINFNNSTIKFYNIDNIDEAKKLTNSLLYMSLEDTKKNCILKQDEYFWFDLIGLKVYENDLLLGKIKDIQRLPSCDYLEVETNLDLKLDDLKKKPKTFLIPYQNEFIKQVDIKNLKILVYNCIDILKAS